MSWIAWALQELGSIRSADRLRRLKAFDAAGPAGILDGHPVISFASNDYLGLAFHPLVRSAAQSAIEHYGTGATASRLIVGTRSLHLQLEEALASWKQTDRALVFPTGYAANLGVLSTLGTDDVTIFSDALNHASIIDGCRLAKAKVAIYRHADVEHLHALLQSTAGRKIIVTDSVFSMDGDVAPLDAIAGLCVSHDAMLVIDEAHAVLGPELPAMEGLVSLRMGTLSKTLGALGGWIAGPAPLIDLLINRARSFIYTTALSPADAAAAAAALQIYRSSEGETLRARLREIVERVRPGHSSPIVPVILGSDRAALQAAETLLAHGIHIPAIRPPTVPPGTSRLRVALSAAHSDAMIERLLIALAELRPESARHD